MSNFKDYGRIGSEIEVTYVGAKNTALAKFSIAVGRDGMKDADGKYITDFHNCQAWGKKAELLEKYGRKGDRIVVEGTLQNNNYEDKNGNKHYGYIINVSDIDFVETKKDREKSDETPKQETKSNEPEETNHNRPAANTSSADDDFAPVPDDDDIPFFDV